MITSRHALILPFILFTCLSFVWAQSAAEPKPQTSAEAHRQLSSLIGQQKWVEAAKVAEYLLDNPEYDWAINKDIETLIRGLRPHNIQQAIKIAERRLPKLSLLVVGPRERRILFTAYRTEELGEMYAEAGDKVKATEFLTSALTQIDVGSQASEELKLAARILSAASRRVGLSGTVAPPLGVTEYIDLAPFKIEDERGKVVLVDFFAHSCAPCVADLTKLDALEKRYGSRGLKVVVVASYRGYFGAREKLTPAEELEALKELREERKARVGFIIGPRTNFESYGVVNLPATALVDRAGKVRAVKTYAKFEELEQLIGALISEPPPAQ